ncbi:hypothetical protein DFH07DRAFT_1063008 [Mycena maculata]|uniref:C2H2-type domain-containing protein n=1 Tax=Mycena maculata TaxID=230809 RepID=A0AAD7N6J0_9AGAR|nr:hypothetical protein DFH07DRAFT_1063008 [Mycena maculata]
MTTRLSTKVHCGQCDLYFADVQARSEHIDSSPFHPLCKTCGRFFLNENSLSIHLKCAAPHWPQREEAEILDGDEILLPWTSNIDIDTHPSHLDVSEDNSDYWSSESEVDNASSTSDSRAEPDSDCESEYEKDSIISFARTEPHLDLACHNLSFEFKFVNSSEIRAFYQSAITDEEEVVITDRPCTQEEDSHFRDESIDLEAIWGR